MGLHANAVSLMVWRKDPGAKRPKKEKHRRRAFPGSSYLKINGVRNLEPQTLFWNRFGVTIRRKQK